MPSIRALLFDMDGTITEPNIDWAALRARVGVPAGMGIMEHIYALSEAEAQRADQAVREIEMQSVRTAAANDGVAELFAALDRRPWKRALVTNNHREAMEHVVSAFALRFDTLLSREDAPLKPAPDLLHLALERLGVSADEAVFIGDGRYDREASAAAGVRYVHLEHDPARAPAGEVIRHLGELLPLLDAGGA
jgi:HAD superfamily hydrolase (TIGR01509 family)